MMMSDQTNGNHTGLIGWFGLEDHREKLGEGSKWHSPSDTFKMSLCHWAKCLTSSESTGADWSRLDSLLAWPGVNQSVKIHLLSTASLLCHEVNWHSVGVADLGSLENTRFPVCLKATKNLLSVVNWDEWQSEKRLTSSVYVRKTDRWMLSLFSAP